MTSVDARARLRGWFNANANHWCGGAIVATLKVTLPTEANKALVEFVADTHIASITLWENGMLEFIVLDLGTKEFVISEDIECNSLDEVESNLNTCLSRIESLTRP